MRPWPFGRRERLQRLLAALASMAGGRRSMRRAIHQLFGKRDGDVRGSRDPANGAPGDALQLQTSLRDGFLQIVAVGETKDEAPAIA
jgi:hypothetical protein